MRRSLPILIFTAAITAAQTTPPAATKTFDANGAASGSWGTADHWDPTGVPSGTDHARIAADKTASASNTNGNTFGTLTLESGSRVNLSASNNSGLKSSADVYLSSGSTFHWASGHSRTSGWPNYRMVDHNSTPATVSLGGGVGIFTGNLYGSADLNVILNRDVQTRLSWTNFSGDVNYTNGGSTVRRLEFGRYGDSTTGGSGTMSVGDKIYMTQGSNDSIGDNVTLRLAGQGSSNYKYNIPSRPGTTPTDVFANLIFDSPIASSGPYITTGSSNSGGIRVTDTTTFTGTAATVELRNGNGGSYNGTKRADIPEVACPKYVFEGSGTWNITGSRSYTNYDFDLGTLGLNDAWPDNEFGGGIITTNADTNISASLKGDAGFIKRGNSRLTVTGVVSNLFGLIICETGELGMTGQIDGLRVLSGAKLGIGAGNVAGETLEILFPYDPEPEFDSFVLSDNTLIDWQYDGATAAGTDYDTIISEAWNLAGITNITVTGASLGYTPSNGDTFHIYQGDVLNYDPGKFTLVMPVVSGGAWELQKDASGLKVVFSATAPYDVWASGTFANPFTQTGDADNQDGDNSLNLSEFAFGTDPTLSDDGAMATDGSAHGKPSMKPDGANMDFYFVRRDDHGTSGSVSYTVQFSTDLSSFTNSATTPTFVADSSVDSDYEVVKVPFPPGSKFARVQVTSVP